MHTIDQEEVLKNPNMSRKILDIDLINATWSEWPRRSTIDFQRCFMGKNMQVLFGDDEPNIDITDR